ncbi:hypothetical protein NKJ66_27280 [Mesorhizobium sp. M0078]|uniref:hypothetical protein n=1 Tax=Mesorhizobium sp. M0078 TaxID=2956871 RepID=UPI00333C2C98
MAIGKLCARLQVPKPPRGYWARVQARQTLRRPPLAAFREELETRRREAARERAAESFSKLQREFYLAALTELSGRCIDVGAAQPRGSRLPDLDADLAAQILLLIQGRAQDWVEEGRIATRWGTSVQSSAARLVERLLPLARAQLLLFETEGTRHSYVASGPVIFVRLTAQLQERIAMLARMVRDQKLQHVVMPLTGSRSCLVRASSSWAGFAAISGQLALRFGKRDLGRMEPQGLARGRSAGAVRHRSYRPARRHAD